MPTTNDSTEYENLTRDLRRDSEIAHHLDTLAWEELCDQWATVRLTERGAMALAAVEV